MSERDVEIVYERQFFKNKCVVGKVDEGLVLVDQTNVDGSPLTCFNVLQQFSSKDVLVGVHTKKTAKYPDVNVLLIQTKSLKHFKTYPNQFPSLKWIRIAPTVKGLPDEVLDQLMIDLLTNNPSLKKNIPSVSFMFLKNAQKRTYSFDISKLNQPVKQEENKVSSAAIEFCTTYGSAPNTSRLKNPIKLDKLEIKLKDLPAPNTRKKVPDYGFVLSNECKNIKEIILPEGLTSFEIASNVKGSEFDLEKISFPSTLSVTNILPDLRQFTKLMLVLIKPAKKIQVKFGGCHFIVGNVKKKMKDSLFYTYSGGYEYGSPYSSGTYGGITYVSLFKQDKLLHYNNGYYYLVENEQGKFYRFLKTDFVDTFDIPKEINGIRVKYIDKSCLSNVKKDPLEKVTAKYGGGWDIELQGLAAYIRINDLEYLDE